jgi:acetoin utilization deacetylase AcuC-like enzyme
VKAFYCDHFTYPLPPGHRFPAEKYALLRAQVAENLVPPVELRVPEPASDEQLLRAHHEDYVMRVAQGDLSEREVRRIGLPWSPELVARTRRSVGGTVAACRAALTEGVAVNLSGGTHHAFADHGEGFCIFNDGAVACRAMQAEGHARRLVILDCDVHQGNGTAAIFAHDPSVFTFSIHGAKNFPFHKERSDLDIELEDDAGDSVYLEALTKGARAALDAARADLAIYLAGADPFAGDTLGRLGVSKAGLAERDRCVLELCHRMGLPVAVVMAGGYARNVGDTAEIHLETVRICVSFTHNASFAKPRVV